MGIMLWEVFQIRLLSFLINLKKGSKTQGNFKITYQKFEDERFDRNKV